MKKIIITIIAIISGIIVAILIVLGLITYKSNSFSKDFTRSKIAEDQPSGLYTFEGTSSSNGYVSHTLGFVSDNSVDVTLSNRDFKWVEYVSQFSRYVYINLSFSDGKLMDRNAIKISNNKDLGKLNDIDILSVVDKSAVEYVSEKEFGEKINDYIFNEFLYNDTDKIVEIIFVDDDFDSETITKKKLKPGEITETDSDYYIVKKYF